MPLPNTVADMWRMVYDQKATCIVMLNPLDANDEVSLSVGPVRFTWIRVLISDPCVGVHTRYCLFGANPQSDH